ncbi:unnamed protein product [Sphacelaria rigidula]
MSMSLVGDYAESDSEEESEEEEEEEEESKQEQTTEATKPSKPTLSLPSAADLFDSVDTASFMSTPGPVPESPYTKAPKGGDARGAGASGKNNSSGKKRKSGDLASKGGEKKESSRGLVPPQMTRPNVVTEDSALWSSDATMKRQRQLEAERRAGGGAAGSGAKGKKGNKDLSFKQREKVKRDKGQQSRGKSYVEEEKRLLRELGSS